MSEPAKILTLKETDARAEAAPAPETKPASEPPQSVQPPKRGRRNILMGGVMLVVLAGTGITYLGGGRTISTDNAYVQGPMLVVSPAVEGTVTRIAVTEGEAVEPGDLLFALDPGPFRIAVAEARAKAEAARLAVRQAQEGYRKALLDIATAESQVALDRQNYERVSALLRTNAVSRAEFDARKAAIARSEGELAALRQAAAAILASLGEAADGPIDKQPNVAAALAELAEAERDLRLSEVRATIAGRAAKVDAIQPGTRLSAGQAAFFVVGDRNLWIEASPKETDLTYLKVGAPADITVDAYPGTVWHGRVSVISPASALSYSVLPAQNASGNWVKVVQRVGVRIALDRTDAQPVLRPGMSALVEVNLGRARSLGDFASGWFGGERRP